MRGADAVDDKPAAARAKRGRREASAVGSGSRGGRGPRSGSPPRRARRSRRQEAGSVGRLRAGSTTRVKPIWAASRMRRAAWPAPRTSPARPTSPKTAVWAGSGRLRKDDAMAAATPRSAAGSAHLEPAGDAHEHVVAQELQAHALLEHGQEQARAVGVEAQGHPAGRPERGGRHEGLDLDQHAAACLRGWPPPPSPASPRGARPGRGPRGWARP